MKAKKKFKSTVKYKYKSAKNQLMQKIMQYEEKDPKTFWKLLNDIKGKKTKQYKSNSTG